jgi:hypothetical protein
MGVILYEGLSGRMPYDSPYVGDLILAIVMGGAKPLHELRPDLDARLCDVVMRAMAHDANARYQTARDLLYALSKVAPVVQDFARSDRPPSNIRVSPVSPLPPRPERIASPQPPRPPAGGAIAIGADSLAGPGALPMSPLVSRRTLTTGALLALALALLFAGVWLGRQRSRGAEAADIKPAATSIEDTPSVAQRPVESVTVELSGLPEGAALMLDGRPASGARFQLEKDGSKHVLSATVEGFAPWSHAFDATEDRRIEVQLVPNAPAPVPPPEVVEAPQPEAPKPRAQPQPRPKPAQPTRPKRLITELDY